MCVLCDTCAHRFHKCGNRERDDSRKLKTFPGITFIRSHKSIPVRCDVLQNSEFCISEVATKSDSPEAAAHSSPRRGA